MPTIPHLIASAYGVGCFTAFMMMCLSPKENKILTIMIPPFINTVAGALMYILNERGQAEIFWINAVFSGCVFLLMCLYLKFFFGDNFPKVVFIYVLVDLYVGMITLIPLHFFLKGMSATGLYIHTWKECFLFLLLASGTFALVQYPVRVFGKRFRKVERLPVIIEYIIMPFFVIYKLHSNLTPYFMSSREYKMLIFSSLIITIAVIIYMYYFNYTMAAIEKEYAEKQVKCQQRYYNNLQQQFLESQRLKEQIESQLHRLRQFVNTESEPEMASYIESLEHLIAVLDGKEV